jgi:hypothetical protein
MSAAILKHGSIWTFLGQLAKELDSERYQVIDHWDADLFAIGLAALGEPRRLVYVSAFGQESGRYVVECEEPDGDKDYQVAGRGEAATFDEVVEMIRRHLSIEKVA